MRGRQTCHAGQRAFANFINGCMTAGLLRSLVSLSRCGEPGEVGEVGDLPLRLFSRPFSHFLVVVFVDRKIGGKNV
jgi:hypothetical protein